MVAVSIDGALVPPKAAKISVFDRGLLHGDGCFETLRTWDGVARDLDAHLDRLYETARFLVLRTIERAKLVEAVYRTIAAAGVATDDAPAPAPGTEMRIRIVLTRGEGPFHARLAEVGPGAAIVIVDPLPAQPSELALAVVDWSLPRRDGRGHKLLSYVDNLIARELARAEGADEAIRLDDDGNVVECASANIFVVSAETVSTPPVDRGGLPGIVRARVLELCSREDLASRVRDLTVRDLRSADELFVTSSLRGVVPVTRLGGVPLAAGPITARLADAYTAWMRSTT